MELASAPSERIAPYLPVQRGHVGYSNRQVLHAILDVAEHGCKWRGLPARFGNWHTISTRMHRWSQNGLAALALDSTSVKMHPDGTGTLQKNGPNPSAGPAAAGPPSCIRWPRMPAPPWRSRSRRARPATRRKGASCGNRLGRRRGSPALVRGRASAGDETRQLASVLGCEPGVPPLRTRIQPGEYDREMDQRRNPSERLWRRWQGFRRSFSRFEKLDGVCLGFIVFALLVDALQ